MDIWKRKREWEEMPSQKEPQTHLAYTCPECGLPVSILEGFASADSWKYEVKVYCANGHCVNVSLAEPEPFGHLVLSWVHGKRDKKASVRRVCPICRHYRDNKEKGFYYNEYGCTCSKTDREKYHGIAIPWSEPRC